MKKVLVIAGPTASGKTSFSIRLAKKLNTEIISGDSIQVYKGFDIGSGKVTEEEMDGVKHYLIDILEPQKAYSAKDFQEETRKLIDSHKEPMIICGGTGMYLKAALYDYTFQHESEEAPCDREFEEMGKEEAYQLLLKVDPEQAKKIHPNNVRRVARALTIYKRTGKKMSDIVKGQSHEPIYDVFIAGLTMDRDVLYNRINHRVEMMFDRGLEQEIKGILESGVTFQDPAMHGIGYQEWKGYFEGEKLLEEVKEEIQKDSRQFAKRQYTWLNHQFPVHWFNPLIEEETNRIEQDILQWVFE